VGDPPSTPHLFVELKQSGGLYLAQQEALPDEHQVVVPVPRPRGEEQRVAKAVDGGRQKEKGKRKKSGFRSVPFLPFAFFLLPFRHRLAESLRQVGMASGPGEDPVQQRPRLPARER